MRPAISGDAPSPFGRTTVATIQLSDNFGLDVSLDPSPASVFVKYLKELAKAEVSLDDFQNISGVTVGSYPFTKQSIGLSFAQPVPLGAVRLQVKPQLSGSILLGEGGGFLDRTLYDKPEAKLLQGQQYLTARLNASVSAKLGAGPGSLCFGFNDGADVVVSYSHPVKVADPLAAALGETLRGFAVPGDVEDLMAMTEKSVASVQGTGTLTLSARVDALTVTNPLATVATGAPLLGSLSLKEGGSIAVNASLTFSGGYQLQVTKLDARRVLLAYFRTRGHELAVSFTAEIGVSVPVGSYDLITLLLQTASPEAVPTADDLKKAGLKEDELAAIVRGIKAGIQRNLQIAFSAELDYSDEHTAAFLYEIDLPTLGGPGTLAVEKAIRGDLSALEGGNLTGVKTLRSVTTTERGTTRSLKLNLLGVLNVGSVSELMQKSTVIIDQDTGDITIADKTTASKVGFTVNNFAADGATLRQVVADGFLTTCVYRASQTGFRSNITSKCWAFALHQSTDFSQIQDYMNIAVGLRLIGRSEADQKLAELKTVGDFGRTLFCADSTYDDALFHRLFFDSSGRLRTLAYYDSIGRAAMAVTLAPGSRVNQARLLPLNDGDLWQKMSGGQPVVRALLLERGFSETEIPYVVGDYGIIKWWASAMYDLGQSLARLLSFLGTATTRDPDDATFLELRNDLDAKMKKVAKQTHDRFAEPWGLVAMDMASGQQSKTEVLVTSPRLSLSLSVR